MDQISFLSLDRPSLDCSSSSSGIGLLPNLSSADLDRTLTRDEDKFFESDEEEPSVKEKVICGTIATDVVHESPDKNQDDNVEKTKSESEVVAVQKVESCNASVQCTEEDAPPQELEETNDLIDEDDNHTNTAGNESDFISKLLNENQDDAETGPLTSTPVNKHVEQKSQEVQTPPFHINCKRKKRSALLNVKRSKKPIFIPVLPGHKLVPVTPEDMLDDDLKVKIIKIGFTFQPQLY